MVFSEFSCADGVVKWFYMQFLFIIVFFFLSCLRDSDKSSHYYPRVNLVLCAFLNDKRPKRSFLDKYIYICTYTYMFIYVWLIWYSKKFYNYVFLRIKNEVSLIKIFHMYVLYTRVCLCIYNMYTHLILHSFNI